MQKQQRCCLGEAGHQSTLALPADLGEYKRSLMLPVSQTRMHARRVPYRGVATPV